VELPIYNVIKIHDQDFSASFMDKKWVIRWKWKEGIQDPILDNTIAHYRIDEMAREEFDVEVNEWIRHGWLQPYQGKVEELIPLLVVVQINKGSTVRPALHFRELNQYLSTHTDENEVCAEKLRAWHKLGPRIKLLDLPKAYLQIHVAPEFW
jgi:hypothetical protein